MSGQDTMREEEGHIGNIISESVIQSQFPPFFFLCFIVLLILFSLDIVTTDLVLSKGGYEKNLFMATVVHFPILHLLIKSAVLFLVLTIARIAEKAIRGAGILGLSVVICWYGVVITNNIHVLLSA